MAGHSKWANIKNKKEKTDAQKGKIFTKIGREIAVAVKEGGGSDPSTNSRLKDVIAKAKASNMPNDNISRSIKKAAGEGDSVNYENVSYEGYGPSGVAIIVDVLTDNRNRTASEIRYIFDRNEGSLGATGCVAWMFDRKGLIVVENSDTIDEDELMMSAIEAGAEDISEEDEAYEIYTSPAKYSDVLSALEEAEYIFASADIEMIPQNTVQLNEEQAEKVMNLIDMMEDNDDVQNIYHNAELPEGFQA
ncbi:MAG TPA: YebC/PmpR family DNA-binding transcriptional regulator [Clostridiales bacterium]|nr:YebC/PmpR family DNA-binding transcriptional regulator [Clostridia bacterium]HCS73189.1 YebC/PmpR family DNA-binding transcriptional regulator [Clostridiales bacterium]